MKQILIVLVFMACALIESPEDYVWTDGGRSSELAVEFNSEQEFVFHNEADFRYKGECNHVANNLNDHENRVLSF